MKDEPSPYDRQSRARVRPHRFVSCAAVLQPGPWAEPGRGLCSPATSK
jgi:hypothetical protein